MIGILRNATGQSGLIQAAGSTNRVLFKAPSPPCRLYQPLPTTASPYYSWHTVSYDRGFWFWCDRIAHIYIGRFSCMRNATGQSGLIRAAGMADQVLYRHPMVLYSIKGRQNHGFGPLYRRQKRTEQAKEVHDSCTYYG